MKKRRILFILKYRSTYQEPTYSYGHYFSSGLYWSAKFVVDMLQDSGVDAKLVQVIDNNDIDREVHRFRPDTVVIEALWVVPAKFDILKRLYPKIDWLVRIHSNVPFLANEGIAIDWIKQYLAKGVKVAVNQDRAYSDLRAVTEAAHLPIKDLLYLPNYYPKVEKLKFTQGSSKSVHIGCFGAIRPMKNQLLQAISAIRYADHARKVLFFYINSGRIEQGDAALSNLEALFKNTRHHLIQFGWMPHDRFLHAIRHLDLGMQVSLSETFSIVAADLVFEGVPIIVSPEVEWASGISKVNPTDGTEITRAIKKQLTFRRLNVRLNRKNLNKYSSESRKTWLNFLK